MLGNIVHIIQGKNNTSAVITLRKVTVCSRFLHIQDVDTSFGNAIINF